MKYIIIVFMILLTTGCGSLSNDPDSLPLNATNISSVGNGWSEFDYNGQRFLYCNKWKGYKGYQAITVIHK